MAGFELALVLDPELVVGSDSPAWYRAGAGMTAGKELEKAGCWWAAGNVGEGTVVAEYEGHPESGAACLGLAAAV